MIIFFSLRTLILIVFHVKWLGLVVHCVQLDLSYINHKVSKQNLAS